MATLPSADRQKITIGLMRFWSRSFEPVAGMTKADLLAAVNATDAWIDDNGGSYNAALPVTPRVNLTLAQKTLIFCVVAAYRVSPAFAKKLVGGLTNGIR